MQRRGFTLPGTPTATESAAECSALCGARSDCVAWSWTACGKPGSSGQCSLKNLLGSVEAGVEPTGAVKGLTCTAAKYFRSPGTNGGAAGDDGSTPIPTGNFTPWGYLQNPYHRVRHRSGSYEGIAMSIF